MPGHCSDEGKICKAMSAEVSPDSKCSICLDIFDNLACLDHCLHMFCFCCIREWSRNKAECPLCKQPFNSIYHSINSDLDYKRYDLKPVDSEATRAGQFRYHRQIHQGTSASLDNREVNMTNFHNSSSDSSVEEETQESSVSPLPASLLYQADETEEEVNQYEGLSTDSDDCIIVGFIKPFAERSPEVVKLSSDSDVSAEEDVNEESPPPGHSLSSTASESTDPGSAGPSENRKRRSSGSGMFPSCNSESTKRNFNQDKPGGKRKYKTKHLEVSLENRDPDPDNQGDSFPKRRKKSKKKHSQKSYGYN